MFSNDSNNFEINLSNYSGSLDVLLDLAKSQKVNLAEISITELANQFNAFINKAKKINLDLASEYLLMATWLTYLKSKLLLPETEEDEFKVLEVAKKLKLQLKKLELIRILSDQMLKRKRLGVNIFTRGAKGGIKSIYSSDYSVTLYEILKSYSNHVMKKDFMRINIPRLPLLTTEEGIKRIRTFFGKLYNWKNLSELIPKELNESKVLKKSGLASIFSGSLELSKEGNVEIKQKALFNSIFIRQKQ
jgi:segregation and condensation protein A